MLRARTTLLASVLLAVVLLVARSAADCITHSGCSRSTYCTRVGVCAACTGCAQATTDAPQSAAASITGSCPCNATQANAAAPCTSHEECVVGAQYCDRLGGELVEWGDNKE